MTMTLVAVVFLLLGSVTQATQGTPPPKAAAPPITSLADAAAAGLVTLSFTGMGGSSGDTIRLRVRRAAKRPMRLRLAPGTVLRSASGVVQDMIVSAVKGRVKSETEYSPSAVIDLPTDEEQIYLVEAYCMDFEKENPGTSDRFDIGPVDTQALAVLRAVPPKQRNPSVIQAALWLAYGITEERIGERFRVAARDMEVARAAIREFPLLKR